MTVKVQAENLSVWYDVNQALKGVNLEIITGEVLALIGPSGCGKSTFLRSLNRLHDEAPGAAVEGQVWLDGAAVYAEDCLLPGLRRRVGMLFQRPNPFPLSLYDNVAYGPRVHGVTERRKLDSLVERSLRAVGLWEEVRGRLGASALGLSGGQQQRLCLARCLAVEPEVLLMDEPTSALDPASTARLEELIRTLKGNYTVVIVTHNLAQARRVADRTAFFLAGELIEAGETAQIFTDAADPRTRDYVSGQWG